MKTERQIMLDYSNAIRQADELDRLARTIEQSHAQEYQAVLNRIQSNWQGDNAEAYYRKAIKLIDELKNNATNLKKTSRAIRTIAENVKRTELTALEIARSRAYNQ